MTQETPINPPETIKKAKLEELVEEWRNNVQETMDETDTERPSYTGNMGSLCMGMKIAADELEELINE